MKQDRRPSYKYRPKPEAKSATPTRPPGYFLDVVRKPSAKCPHGWPPHFTPKIQRVERINVNGDTTSEVAARTREAGLAEGRSYAMGTIPMHGTPKATGPKGWL